MYVCTEKNLPMIAKMNNKNTITLYMLKHTYEWATPVKHDITFFQKAFPSWMVKNHKSTVYLFCMYAVLLEGMSAEANHNTKLQNTC